MDNYDVNKTFALLAGGLIAANLLLPASAGFGIITTGAALYFMLRATNAIRRAELRKD